MGSSDPDRARLPGVLLTREVRVSEPEVLAAGPHVHESERMDLGPSDRRHPGVLGRPCVRRFLGSP